MLLLASCTEGRNLRIIRPDMKTNWAALIRDLNGVGMTDSAIADAVGVEKFSASAVKQLRSTGKKRTKSPRYEAGKKLLDLHAQRVKRAA